jgi:tRNA(Ile)-lysidine synthetase-like protein
MNQLYKMLWNLFNKIISFFTGYIYYCISFFKYSHNYILEYPNNYSFDDPKFDLLVTIPDNHPLVKTIEQFLIKYNKNNKSIIVSLSGGIDSMVLVSILWKLSKKYNFKLYSATIDYSTRKESKYEADFTRLFCKKYGIDFNLKTIEGVCRESNDNSRNEYEEESRSVRYGLYNKLLDETKAEGIYVAHHYDDITENVFTNFMKGANILDLVVMHDVNNVRGVNIMRPFLNHPKKDIYDFAHTYNIPYFKNTTPIWCKRGIMREKLFKMLDNMFGIIFRKNLNDLGQKSYQIGNLVSDKIINPFLNKVVFCKYGAYFKLEENNPDIFWELILIEIFHKFGTSSPSKKSLKLIIDIISKNKESVYPIKKGYYFVLEKGTIYLMQTYFTRERNEMEVDIKKNMEKSEKKITLVDILNGKITYSIPDINKELDNLQISKKNIIKILNLSNKIPNNILKYFELPSYNIEIDHDDKSNRGKEMIKNIDEWLNVDITI